MSGKDLKSTGLKSNAIIMINWSVKRKPRIYILEFLV